MVNTNIFCGSVDNVECDYYELCRRLQIPRVNDIFGDSDSPKAEAGTLVEKCERQLKAVMQCRYAAVRIPVEYPAEGLCRLDFADIESRDLYKNLSGCKEIFLFAVTLGIGVDRLLHRLNLTSQSEHFITDALSSAMAEALCDRVDDMLTAEVMPEFTPDCRRDFCRPRFSPGYGDLDISVQKPLLLRLHADKTLGITLNSAYLMTPVKSVTAIMGICADRTE